MPQQGDFGIWGRSFMMAQTGGWYWPGPLGHLGTMLPMAIAVKIERPAAPVVCFCGDGAVGFYFIELDTAVRHNLPVIVVIGNDAAWGIDKSFQQANVSSAPRICRRRSNAPWPPAGPPCSTSKSGARPARRSRRRSNTCSPIGRTRHKRIRDDYEQFFDQEVPPKALAELLARARAAGMLCHVGFCERDGARHFNTAILTDETGAVCGRFRKIHLPGLDHVDARRAAPVYEPYYFETGDTGFQVFPTSKGRVGIAICQDRRYSETYRCLGLQGAEIVLIGYNTPAQPLSLEHNELVMRAGAYENSLFVLGIAKAGVEDGMELIGGSCVISPLGVVLARAATTGDELVAARIDLDQIDAARRRWNFFGRRHPEHYKVMGEPVKDEWKEARLATRR